MLCCYVKKNDARYNENNVKTVLPDVIDIDYSAMVSFGFHQKCFLVLKVRIMEVFLPEGAWNLVQIKEIIELQRFELREVIYENFMESFISAKKLVRIKEIIELSEVELQRVTVRLVFMNIPLIFKQTWQEIQTSERKNSKMNITS